MSTPPSNDFDSGPPEPRGPRVADAETLLRVITPGAAGSWIKPDGTASSLMFDPPLFSVDVERLSSVKQTLSRWPAGSGVAAFPAGGAWALGFHAHHHPELDNDAHANIYSELNNSQRKKAARTLAALTVIREPPVRPADS